MRRPLFVRYGEVYVWRVNQAGRFRRLFVPRHTGYIGQTRNPVARDAEHLLGGGRYGKPPAPWSDLDPVKYVIFRMEHCPQWLLDWVEVTAIKVLRPVYNHSHNHSNPRRVGLTAARVARAARDTMVWRH